MDSKQYFTKGRKIYLLVIFLLGIIIPSLILAFLGFQSIQHRDYWMRNMAQENARKSAIMLVQEVEGRIIELEKQFLMDLTMEKREGENDTITEAQLQILKKKYLFIQDIYFFDAEYMLKYSIQSDAQPRYGGIKEWLLSRILFDIKKRKPIELELRHLSDVFIGIPVQIGYISLPHKLKGKLLGYLVFFLDIDFIRSELLNSRLLELNNQEPHQRITVENLDEHYLTGDTLEKGQLIIEIPFTRVLTFWKIKTALEISALQKHARQELISYSGLILIILVLIGASIFLTLRYIRQEWKLSQIKSEMVSHVSHELKTPLALIRMYAETLMLGRVTQEQKVMEYYHIIIGECERLTLLINNILDFSVIEKGAKEYHPSKGDLAEILHLVFNLYSHYVRQNGFNLHLRIEEQIPPFNFDKMAMTQAILNLLDNAMKFSREKKEIDIDLKRQDGKAVIRITDQGIGINSREIDRIFEPFYRGSDITQGAGIGLALVKHIAEAHGGKVTVESKVNRGSTFAIWLPIQGD